MPLAVALLLGGCGQSVPPPPPQLPAQHFVAQSPGPVTPDPPARLVIPSLGIDAPVDATNKSSDAPSKPDHVAWYQAVVPGNSGDAVINGHRDYACLGCPAVFWRLPSIQPNELVWVQDARGHSWPFQVTQTATVGAFSSPPGLFTKDGPPKLTLYTCNGTWDQRERMYSSRFLVTTQLVTT